MLIIKQILLKFRRIFSVTIFLFLIGFVYILSFYVRFDFSIPGQYVNLILRTLAVVILIKMVVFNMFGLLSGLWRYVSIEDLWNILKANTVATFFVHYICSICA